MTAKPPSDPTDTPDSLVDDAGWQIRAEMAIASIAASDRLITYAELADAAGLQGKHRIKRLTLWLESTIEADAATATTLRAARVISRARGGLPAPGFFVKCSTLGLYDGPADGPQAYAFHLNCLR